MIHTDNRHLFGLSPLRYFSLGFALSYFCILFCFLLLLHFIGGSLIPIYVLFLFFSRSNIQHRLGDGRIGGHFFVDGDVQAFLLVG